MPQKREVKNEELRVKNCGVEIFLKTKYETASSASVTAVLTEYAHGADGRHIISAIHAAYGAISQKL